jgi:hypothetical protein
MKKLEEYIRKNRQQFDDAEPRSGHIDRFAARLKDFEAENEKPVLLRFSVLWRAAAAILLLITVSLLYNRIDTPGIIKSGHSQDLPAEIIEATHYYASLNHEKINTIGELAANKPESGEIVSLAKQEAETIESNSDELKKKYSETRDDRIIDAIIANYRVLSELLDHMIHRLNEVR